MNRLAIVGAGHRALTMYLRPLRDDFSESARIVGICDSNPLRAAYLAREVPGVPAFDDFDVMMRATAPDTVIVTTIDREHDRYVVAALEAGARVICEKPLAIDAAKVRAILDAQARTGRSVTVTFNYRYVPYMEAIKRLVAADAIGRPLNVDFEWLLDRSHGADYFRRWHRRKENSGGLLVHKASHHFDLVNCGSRASRNPCSRGATGRSTARRASSAAIAARPARSPRPASSSSTWRPRPS
jgi:predicted dehydrogenase